MAQQISGGWGRRPVGHLGDFGLDGPFVRRWRRGLGLRYLVAVVRAEVCRWGLDAALGAGANPCDSPALARRAARLTSRASRHRLADSVDGVLAAAARPGPGLSTAVQPCREEVAAAAALLIEIGDLLRSTAPVYCRGVAMIRRLLADGGARST